jgi:hypothetical protein
VESWQQLRAEVHVYGGGASKRQGGINDMTLIFASDLAMIVARELGRLSQIVKPVGGTLSLWLATPVCVFVLRIFSNTC